MGNYPWVVIETYPDGGTWMHFFESNRAAARAVKDMERAHVARRYELRRTTDA